MGPAGGLTITVLTTAATQDELHTWIHRDTLLTASPTLHLDPVTRGARGRPANRPGRRYRPGMPNQPRTLASGSAIRTARQAAGLSQQSVADRVGGISQVTVSNWERGQAVPTRAQRTKLRTFLATEPPDDTGPQVSAFGAWLEQSRGDAALTRGELAKKSGISSVQIANIEQGRTKNPQAVTRQLLEKALDTSIPEDVESTTRAAADVPDLGTLGALSALEDFDPHNEIEWPKVPGVYVLYDAGEHPVYVGESQNIASRLRSHREKNWWIKHFVHSGSFVTVTDKVIRHSLEQVLIRFLKSHAVINEQSVQR